MSCAMVFVVADLDFRVLEVVVVDFVSTALTLVVSTPSLGGFHPRACCRVRCSRVTSCFDEINPRFVMLEEEEELVRGRKVLSLG